MPKLNVIYRNTGDLIPYANNARTHSDEQISQIAASIKEFGFTNAILVDGENGIIAGHGRALAAKRLNMGKVPCIELSGLSDAQRKAYILADNRLAQNAGWDNDLLRIELNGLGDMDFDLSLIGFGEDELSALMADAGVDGLTDPDEVPEVPDEPVTKPGDVWLLGKHRLVCGDSTNADDVAKALNGIEPHLMVTDPPYGVGYDATWRGKAGLNPMGANRTGIVENDDTIDWQEAWGLFPGNIVYVWHGGLHAGAVADSLIGAGFQLRAQIIWNKTVMAMSRGDYHWKHEPCWYAVKGTGNWTGDRKQTTVWEFPSPIHIMGGSKETKTSHPTQKPVECMKRPIENNSSPGQAVYEPFSGSGTTIIAGEMTGRSIHAIEISPAYCDVGIIRWSNFSGGEAVLEETQETFAQVKERRDSIHAPPKKTGRRTRKQPILEDSGEANSPHIANGS